MRCLTCIHCDVCRLRAEAEEIVATAEDLALKSPVAYSMKRLNIRLDITCDNYHERKSNNAGRTNNDNSES